MAVHNTGPNLPISLIFVSNPVRKLPMKNLLLLLACIAFLGVSAPEILAATGDTVHVITHNQQVVVTNPGSGSNPYPAWAVFPPASTKYRKVVVHMSYRCPNGQACGEWDYLDYVFLRRQGGVASPSKNMEIVRFITPYGNSFSQTWKAEFQIDITDYQMFLHDSVEIEYIHTGYETNVGKGWVVTLDFMLIEGQPPMEPLAITPLWNGTFPYGNAANPIENFLVPVNLTMQANTELLRVRMLQTGHGSDNANCAEFCQRTRFLKFDSVTAFVKNIWKLCGTNPLYPQAGTWVYNRSNWCPGMLVYPDIYDFPVTGGSTHQLDADMSPYTAANPSANYRFGSQAIEYLLPTIANDASIEEIYQPSDHFGNSRNNPVCDYAKVRLRNNGTTPLTSATIKFGIIGMPQSTFNWSGNLGTGTSTDVTLNDYILPAAGMQTFRVYLESVNGMPDQYPHDDTVYSTALIPAVLDTIFIFNIKTNSIPSQTYYRFYDHNNTIVHQVFPGTLTANTTYNDTLVLPPGCYRFTLYDSGGDGLTWWANPNQGSGYARFMKYGGGVYKTFNPDFGSETSYNFLVDPANIVSIYQNEAGPASVAIYPNPTPGQVILNISVPGYEEVQVTVYDNTGREVHHGLYEISGNGIAEFDLGNRPAGIYFIHVLSASLNESRKIILQP